MLFSLAIFIYIIYLGYKEEKRVTNIFNELAAKFKKKATFLSVENSKRILNKYIVATFDNNKYIRTLKILYLSDTKYGLHNGIMVYATSDIPLSFTLFIANYSMLSFDKLTKEQIFSLMKKYFSVKCSKPMLFERYFNKDNIFTLFRGLDLFYTLEIKSSDSEKTTFKVEIEKVSIFSILSAIALFESLLQLEAYKPREKIITTIDQNSKALLD